MELAQLFCGTMKVKEWLFGYRGRSLSYICWFVVYIYTALFRRRDRWFKVGESMENFEDVVFVFVFVFSFA